MQPFLHNFPVPVPPVDGFYRYLNSILRSTITTIYEKKLQKNYQKTKMNNNKRKRRPHKRLRKPA